MVSLKVIVVDDSFITVSKITQILTSLGHRVVATAKTGLEAINAAMLNDADIITMDITMPDMDGIEACRRILKIKPHLLIIMITSHGQERMVLSAIEAGAKGYLLKPIEEENLSNVINSVYQKYAGV